MSNRTYVSISVVLLAVAIVYLSQFFLTTGVSFDLGLVPLGAALVAGGGHLYRDMHEVMFPGSFLFLAMFFKCFGTSWMVCKVVAVSVFLTIAILLLTVARQLMNSWMAFIPFIIFVVLGGPVCALNYYHWDALMWFLAFACALVPVAVSGEHLQPAKNRRTLLVLLLSGLFGGFSTLSFQPAAMPVLIGTAAAAYIAHRAGKTFKQSLLLFSIVVGGWAAVMLLLLLYTVSSQSLTPMYESTIKFVIDHYSTVNKVSYGYSSYVPMLMERVPLPLGLFVGAPFYWIDVLPVVVLLLAVVPTERKAQPTVLKWSLALWTVLGFAYWMMSLHRPDIRRLFWCSQPLMVAAWGWLEYLAARNRVGARQFKVASISIAGVIVVGLLLNGWLCTSDHGAFITYQTPRGAVTTDSNLEIVQAMAARCKPGEKAFVYPYDTVIYFLTDTRFPSRFPYLQYGYHTAEQIDSVLKDMDSSQVKYAAVNKRVDANSFAHYGFPGFKPVQPEQMVVERYLAEHYQPIGDFGDYQLLERRR